MPHKPTLICTNFIRTFTSSLFSDISLGRESNQVMVVNEVDDEPFPDDFLYVSDYIETVPINVNRVITSLKVGVENADDMRKRSFLTFIVYILSFYQLCNFTNS